MLKTEQNTPEVQEQIQSLIERGEIPGDHGPFATHFEHGQWWVTCHCGASWSVVDAEGPDVDPEIGLDFEQVDNGDEDFHREDPEEEGI